MATIPELMQATYEIRGEIARGGMSTVYLARHRRLNTLWAIKEVRRADYPNFDLLAEANILKQLNHPMLPHIADIFDTPEAVYLVEEYVEGQDLRERIKTNGPAPEDAVRGWALSLCDVLEYLHGHTPPIIYRDMKPANIMQKSDGTLKLVDFGIARVYKKTALSDTTFAGTRGFAAPEQFTGRQTDPRTDIYSLGVTLYYLLTGKSPADPPYELLPLRQVNPALSPSMESIVARCTAPDPEDRYQDVRRLQADLQAAARKSAQAARSKRRRVGWTAAAVAVLLAGLTGAGAFLVQYRKNARLKQMDILYADALAALNESDEETAVEKLQTLLTMDPARGEACLALGNAYLAQAGEREVGDEQKTALYDQAQAMYDEAEALGQEVQQQRDALAQAREATRRDREQWDLLAAAYDTFAGRDWEAIEAMLMQQDYQELFYREQTDPIVYDQRGENVLAAYPLPDTEYRDRRPGFFYYGTMENGERSGQGLWYYEDGTTIYRYDGAWKNDLPNGSGTVYAAQNQEEGETMYGTVPTLWEESTGNFVDGCFDGMFRVRNESGDGTLIDVQMDHDRGYHVAIPYEELPAYCRAVFSRADFDAVEAQGAFVKAVCMEENGDVIVLFGTPEERCVVKGVTVAE